MKKIAVIGSGLGGLAAALSLARAGHRVTLFERQAMLGGYSVHFRRKGFVFDPALHAIPGGGPDQAFGQLARRLGLEGRLRFVRLAQGPRVFIGSALYDLPNDEAGLFAYLGLRFPHEAAGIERFRRALAGQARVYGPVLMGKPTRRQLLRFILSLPAFLARSFGSTKDWLGAYFKDQDLIALLYSYVIFMGVPSDRFPAINFIMMSSLMLNDGYATIAGGGGELVKQMLGLLKEHGAVVKAGCGVSELRISAGRARSVLDDRGEEHEVDAVIANLNPQALAGIARPVGSLDAWAGGLAAFKPSISVVQLHLGLDCPVTELGIGHYLEFWLPGGDLDASIEANRQALLPGGFSLTAPGLADATVLPGNERVLSLTGAVSGPRWLGLSEAEYLQAKRECRDAMLARLEERLPGIRSRIVAEDLATPRTFQRYTGNPDGALMGYECPPGGHRALAAACRVPIGNVFLANAWTSQGGGFLQSLRAGEAAARAI